MIYKYNNRRFNNQIRIYKEKKTANQNFIHNRFDQKNLENQGQNEKRKKRKQDRIFDEDEK